MGLWYRLCVDVDRAGNVIGASYERHRDDQVDRVHVTAVGPFDTRHEALDQLWDELELQGRLFT